MGRRKPANALHIAENVTDSDLPYEKTEEANSDQARANVQQETTVMPSRVSAMTGGLSHFCIFSLNQ